MGTPFGDAWPGRDGNRWVLIARFRFRIIQASSGGPEVTRSGNIVECGSAEEREEREEN
jgi:hypothetical protein